MTRRESACFIQSRRFLRARARRRFTSIARTGLSVCLAWATISTLAGCPAPSASSRARASKNDAVVLIQCDVADAELWVDDRFVAHVESLRRGIALSPGTHRIELRHDEYHTHYEMLTLGARERKRLDIELAEILP